MKCKDTKDQSWIIDPVDKNNLLNLHGSLCLYEHACMFFTQFLKGKRVFYI